jgi:uncharacterized protein
MDMADAQLSFDDLIHMTARDGEGWGLPHVRRLMALVQEIGADLPHDSSALELAIVLHDWGAFACYRVAGVDHALRSRQVAEREILPRVALDPSVSALVLDAIELHDYRDTRPAASNEALLLREADMLDFLGMIGTAREFAWGPNDLEVCTRRILARRAAIRGRLTIPRAQEIARVRLERMDTCLRWLEEETSESAGAPNAVCAAWNVARYAMAEPGLLVPC